MLRADAPLSAYRFAVPQAVMFDGIDTPVARAFERALATLRAAGARIEEIPLEPLRELAGMQANGTFSAAESYAWHRSLITERAAEYDPRPTFTDPAKTFFDFGNQLVLDRIAVRSVVGRVHPVGIVVERRRVLDLDQQHAWKPLASPGLEQLPFQLLLDAVVALELEAFAVLGHKVRIRG